MLESILVAPIEEVGLAGLLLPPLTTIGVGFRV